LIAALMVLQTRGRTTARQLAEELEVSERTARRDLEALAMSGVPVFSTHGRGGGWELVGGARTDLTGLTADEAQALFLAVGPQLGTALALDSALASALRKLTSALPETFRPDASTAQAAIKIDPTGWGQVGGPAQPDTVPILIRSVLAGKQVRMQYVRADGKRSNRVVHPLGMVTKREVWYLVANTSKGVRTFRADRVGSTTQLTEDVQRPGDFDLDEAWDSIVTAVESERAGIRARAMAAPSAIKALRYQFGTRLEIGQTGDDGRVEITLTEVEAAPLAAQIAGYGSQIELTDPSPELVAEFTRIASELTGLYSGEPAGL